MVFNPCIMIPIYNHGDCIADTIAGIKMHGLPIFVVDDGSDGPTKRALSEIRAAHPEIRFLTRPINGGKGAALKDGFRAAFDAGFTHALQMDADGQHDSADVPKFIDSGRNFPTALICGDPVFDSSIPKSRLYGRRITNFWVALETLSMDAPDAMCGFRLYPLSETLKLINSCRIGNHMEFEIDTLVGFNRLGLLVQKIRTKVCYPDGGHSNFRMFRDNILISMVHTRLTVGMILLLPGIIINHIIEKARS